MTQRCPACQRSFSEPGFCPFDGSRLEEQRTAAAAPTIVADDPSKKMQSVSAKNTGGHGDAMASIRGGRDKNSEYDRLIGETLDGRYYVQKKLGEGGMGVVFAVKHTVIERPLAIKVLKREVMRDPATVKRFMQEARAASRIGHPNIVDVTDFGNTADGMTYQVMELIDGVTLKEVVKTTAPLPIERVVRIGLQMARALVAAHAKGIVHRDLKPENVFLTEREGRPDFVKIVDFGIAKVAPVDGKTDVGPRLTRQGTVFGTPEYMAPEQAAGRSDTDHRVDVYAIGTILYEMIVGKVPHKGQSMVQTVAMQMLDAVIPPSQRRPDVKVPAELEAVIMKALQKKREDRYEAMSDLQAALDDVAARISFGAPATDPAITPPPTTQTAEAQAAETAVGAPRRAKPPTRPIHEPQFVERQTPVSFDHIYDDAAVEPDKRSRWPMLVAGLAMLVLGAGGAILLLMKLQKHEPSATSARASDAAVIAELPHDARTESPAPDDAASVVAEVPVDAGTSTTVRAGRVAGVGKTTPGLGKGNVTIEILTRPGDANVFVGRNYRGPSGLRLTERRGTKLKIECKTDRMKGSIEVVFDGNLTAVMCNAVRDRFCVTGLKNPYDDCEEDPNASP
jgi:serine/threonine-protein kinase